MPSWEALPTDLVLLILQWRRALAVEPRAAVLIQSAWRRYRTYVLLGRFRMLQFLHDFRAWNPSAAVFLSRARL